MRKLLSNKEGVKLIEIKLGSRKGIFPYEWLHSVDKLNNTELPPKDAFCSKFKPRGITDEEYNQTLNCWKDIKCKTIKIYMLSYFKLDVVLQVDVFEKFSDMCLLIM